MKFNLRNIYSIAMALVAVAYLSSCSDSKSYAEYLSDEKKSCNAYLATQRVINDIPADSIFEYGTDAPYYRMTEDGDVYMQVIKPGDRKNNKAEDNQQIYFRFMRINLNTWAKGIDPTPEGNADDMGFNTFSFRFNNYTLSSSTQYGAGLQIPLKYLGIDCQVNILIKSQYGFTSEISNVVPYLYQNVRYFKSQI